MLNARIIVLAILCALLTTAGQVLLKMGVSHPALSASLASGDLPGFFARAIVHPLVFGGLSLYAVSTVLWLVVLARAELSYALPLLSLGFVFSVIYGHFAMSESVGLLRASGVVLIMAGVVCVARS